MSERATRPGDESGGRRPWPTDGPTVAEVGESALLARITSDPVTSPAVLVGPGDDAAVLAGGGPLVLTTDVLVERRHFRTDWSTPEEVGAKAIIANAADVAAMGGAPTAFVVALACPPQTPAETLYRLHEGIAGRAAAVGGVLVGGDLAAAAEIVVSVTAVGRLETAPVRLSGARVGDVVAVSGPLGGSAAGYAVLSSGSDAVDGPSAAAVAAHRVPIGDPAQGVVAATAGATAMTDVSDGLISDLGDIARASAVRLAVDAARVPAPSWLVVVAERLGADSVGWVLAGGEDHQLAATFPPGSAPAGWAVVGDVVAGDPGVVVVGAESAPDAWTAFG